MSNFFSEEAYNDFLFGENSLQNEREHTEFTWGTRLNALGNTDEAKQEKSIANLNGALKYGLLTAGSFEILQRSLEKEKKQVTPQAENLVNRYAPGSAAIFTMADNASSLVNRKYFKEIAQYEKTMRELYAENAPKDLKLLGTAENTAYKADTLNTLESVLYGLGAGLDNAKRGIETALHDFFKRRRYESIMPENMKNVDWKSITDEGIRELAKAAHPDNTEAQEQFYRYYARYKDIILDEAEHLFENAPEWLRKAQETGGLNEFLFDVSAGISQLVPMVAASAATGGGYALPMAASFVMQYGSFLEQYRNDPLAKQENVRSAALLGAVLTSAFDAAGGKAIAGNLLKPKSALGQTAKNWLIGAGTEGATEYAQAYPELLAQYYAQGRFDEETMLGIESMLGEFLTADFQKDAAYQGGVGFFAGAGLGAVGLRAEYKKKAEQIANITEGQKLAKEHPEIFQRLAVQLQQYGVEMPNIFVSAKTVDSLKQERSPETTDFDKQPLDIFLEEAGISLDEYQMSLAGGGTLEISAERLHKVMQTDMGLRLLQANAMSTSSRFETDGMDSLLGSLYQVKKGRDKAAQDIENDIAETENANAEFDGFSADSLQTEAELTPEENAEVQRVQAQIDSELRAYNEEKYLVQQIAKDIEENTSRTDNPYTKTQSNTLASLFMAEIRTFAENYNIPLQAAYNQRRPVFLGSVASGGDIDAAVAKAKEQLAAGNFDRNAVDRALYQLNPGVNLDAPVRVVTAEPKFAGRNVWEFTKNKEVSKLKKELAGVYRNNDTGWDIKLTGYGVEHAVSSAGRRGIGGIEHLEAVANLPRLIENAVLAESHADRKEQGLSAVHRMYAPMSIGSDVFTVKLTVKEYDNQMVVEVDDIRKLYDVALEKKMPYGANVPPHTPLETAGSGHSTQGISEITLRTMLEDVKDSEGNRFFQQQREIMFVEEKLREEVKKWKQSVDSLSNKPKNNILMLQETPLAMKLVGADFKELHAAPHVFDGIFINEEKNPKHNAHPNIDRDVLKKIPEALTDPVAVYRDDKNGDRFIFVTDITDKNGSNVVVPVDFEAKTNRAEINLILTVYAKDNNKNQSDFNWFFKNAQNLVYINRKKDKEFWQKNKHLLKKASAYANGVMSAGSNSLWDVSQSLKLSVRNEADLVKLKKQHVGFYQAQNNGFRGSIQQIEGAKSVIRFFTSADISTGFHEFGHYIRFAMEQKAFLENAREQDVKDWETLCGYVGAKPGEKWTREQEEFAADSILRYLESGEAPSSDLRRIFTNIARWLTNLYKKISRTGTIEISEQMKAVFDRQLATEREILAARQKLGIAEMNTVLTDLQAGDLSFMDGEDREKFDRAVSKADAEAYAKMTEKKARELEESRKVWKRNAELAYKLDRDTAELSAVMDGGGIYLSEEMRQQYADSLSRIRKKRPFQYGKLFTADNRGTDIDLATERFGFEGEGARESLLGHLAQLPNKQEFIASYMLEQETAWRKSWTAEENVLNDAVAEALEIYAKSLGAKAGAAVLDNAKLRRAVSASLRKNRIEDIEKHIEKYETAARENSLLEKAQARKIEKLEDKILRQRLEYMEKKRIALAVLREKYKAKEMKQKGIRYVKRAAKTKLKDIDFAYAEQIRALGNKFGFTGRSLAPRDKVHAVPLREFAEKHELDMSVFPEWLLKSPADEQIAYKDLTVGEFGELMDVFKFLEHHGKDIKKIEIAGQREALLDRVSKLTASMDSLESKKSITDWEEKNKKGKSVYSYLRKLNAELTNHVYEFMAADGYRKGQDEVNGIFYKTFRKPLYQAQERKNALLKTMDALLADALAPIRNMPKEKRLERWTLDVKLPREAARKWGETNSWTYERMIMVALNMGNADNMKKLMDGYGWTREDLNKITARMTEQDWLMVQKIWDTVNMLYPEMNAVYREVNGIPMKKVEADKLETPYGILQGGYFPLVYDGSIADISIQKRNEFELLQENSFSVNIAKVADGFTKDRAAGVKIPVKLSFDVIGRHVTDSVQYIAYAKEIHNLRKILRNNDFAAMYRDKFGTESFDDLESWLANIAKPQRDKINHWERGLEKARELGTIYALGYNIKTAVMSFTGFAPVVHEIGLARTLKAMAYMLANRKQAYEEIRRISSLMANRENDINHDIAANLAKYNPANAPTMRVNVFGQDYDFYYKDIQRYAFSLVTMTDIMVSYTAWIGVFHKALDENGGDIEKARDYADIIVERTQSSGTGMHTAALQRGNGLKKIMTMFMTYSLNYYNNLRYQTRGLSEGKIGALEYASWLLWYHTFPAVMTYMFNELWQGGELPVPWSDDEEEREKAFKGLGQEIFVNSFIQGLPVVRQFPSVYEYGQDNVTGSSVIDRGLTAPLDAVFAGGYFLYALIDDSAESEKSLGKFIKHSVNTASYWTGIPAHRVLQIYEKVKMAVDKLNG